MLMKTILTLLLICLLLSSCTALRYSNQPSYLLCKQLESQIQFGGNTSRTPKAQSANVDKIRLQATYDTQIRLLKIPNA